MPKEGLRLHSHDVLFRGSGFGHFIPLHYSTNSRHLLEIEHGTCPMQKFVANPSWSSESSNSGSHGACLAHLDFPGVPAPPWHACLSVKEAVKLVHFGGRWT